MFVLKKRSIDNLRIREILDSRGRPTLEADVILTDGSIGRASVPSGASTGNKEAFEKRDFDSSRYKGLGVKKTALYAEELIRKTIIGCDVCDQNKIDSTLRLLDGTDNKSNLGANSILAVSIASCKAAAASIGFPVWKWIGGISINKMPIPMTNLINGGAHADSKLRFQEFMTIPGKTSSFIEGIRECAETFYSLMKIAKRENRGVNVGDEGGLALYAENAEDALDLLSRAVIEENKNRTMNFALDVAASEFFTKEGKYEIDDKIIDASELVKIYKDLKSRFPLVSLEDGMAEDDNQGWVMLKKEFGSEMMLVGDDLFATNYQILKDKGSLANALLVKCNQIGTITETIEAVNLAKSMGYYIIVSHRSGDTEDTFISHLAVGIGADYVKMGSVCRSERTAKYNELIRIESGVA